MNELCVWSWYTKWPALSAGQRQLLWCHFDSCRVVSVNIETLYVNTQFQRVTVTVFSMSVSFLWELFCSWLWLYSSDWAVLDTVYIVIEQVTASEWIKWNYGFQSSWFQRATCTETFFFELLVSQVNCVTVCMWRDVTIVLLMDADVAA